MPGVLPDVCERYLVRAEGALGGLAVDHLGSRPTLRRAHDDGRPTRALDHPVSAGPCLDREDALIAAIERRGERLVYAVGIISLHAVDLVAVGVQQRPNVIINGPTEHGRAADLV